MASKQVTDRQKAATAVGVTVETYADRLEAGIAAALSDAPEVAAAAMVMARATGAKLAASSTRMVQADETHAVELADDAGLRAIRATDAEAVRGQLVDLREGLVGLYGAAAPTAVGFAGSTPEDPVSLVRLAREVATGLLKDVLPAPKYETATIDPAKQAATLERLASKLELSLKGVAEDLRENQVTRTARDAAMAEHDTTFSRAANYLTALYALAGEPELAERVRPSTRSPGRLASTEAETPEPPAAAEPPGPAPAQPAV